ncbi:MAG: hypothetical protein ACOY94_09065 [Bacillota bacterium]
MIRSRFKGLLVGLLAVALLAAGSGVPAGADTLPLALVAQGPEAVITGQENQYTVQLTNTSGTPVEEVRVSFVIEGEAPLAEGDVTVYYQAGDSWLLLPMTLTAGSLQGWFGPAAGFTVGSTYDATSTFRVTFNQSNLYEATFQAVNAGDSTTHYSPPETISVTATSLALTTTVPAQVVAGEEHLFSVQLANVSGIAYSDVRVAFVLSPVTTADDVEILYEEGAGDWVELPMTLEDGKLSGWFGPAAGFPVSSDYSVTSQFKVTFKEPGTYGVNIRAVRVAEPERTLGSTYTEVEVLAPPTLVLSVGGPTLAMLGHQNALTVNLQNTGDLDAYNVVVRFEITGPTFDGLRILYREGSEWAELPFTVVEDEEGDKAVGTFGPSTGFTVPAGYDQTSLFMVTYPEEGVYSATFTALSLTDDDLTPAIATRTITVRAEKGQGGNAATPAVPAEPGIRPAIPAIPAQPGQTAPNGNARGHEEG